MLQRSCPTAATVMLPRCCLAPCPAPRRRLNRGNVTSSLHVPMKIGREGDFVVHVIPPFYLLFSSAYIFKQKVVNYMHILSCTVREHAIYANKFNDTKCYSKGRASHFWYLSYLTNHYIAIHLGWNNVLQQHRLGLAVGGGEEVGEPKSGLGSCGREGQPRAGLHVNSTANRSQDMLIPLSDTCETTSGVLCLGLGSPVR